MASLVVAGIVLLTVSLLYAALVAAFYFHDSNVEDENEMWIW
jgi:hypothetical protein